jgi:hypothetical protein
LLTPTIGLALNSLTLFVAGIYAFGITRVLHQLKLPYMVAIRSNHGVWMPKGQQIRYNRWRPYDQPLSEHPRQRRDIREVIFGNRFSVRYYQITQGSTDNPDKAESGFIMTSLLGDIILSVGLQYTQSLGAVDWNFDKPFFQSRQAVKLLL